MQNTQRQLVVLLYPASRPTAHLRRGYKEIRGENDNDDDDDIRKDHEVRRDGAHPL